MRLPTNIVLVLFCLMVAGSGCALTGDPTEEVLIAAASESNRPAQVSSHDPSSDVEAGDRQAARRTDATATDDPVSASTAGRAAHDRLEDKPSIGNSIESQLSSARAAGEITAAQETQLRSQLQAMPGPLGNNFLAQMLAFNRMGRSEASVEPSALSPKLPKGELAVRHPVSKTSRLDSGDSESVQEKVSRTSRQLTKSDLQTGRETTTDEWKIMLKSAIRSLEDSLASDSGKDAATDANRQASLRMLYMLSGHRDASMRPIAGLEREEQDFWSEMIYGLSTYMDEQAVPNSARRASLATGHMRTALSSLSAQGNLVIHNLAFCRNVNSFGRYDKFDTKIGDGRSAYIFKPGQEVLLYVEVQNFTSESTADGFHTSLKPSYAIVNAQGAREVPMHPLKPTSDYCRQRRQDFFDLYRIYLPERISPGRYKLELEIVDEKSNKLGQNMIDFEIQSR